MKKLATLVVGLFLVLGVASTALAASRTLAAGQMTEWYAYLAMVGSHYSTAKGTKLVGYPTMAMDTMSTAHNYIKDTYTIPNGGTGYFPFIFQDDEAESFGVWVYRYLPDRYTTASTMALIMPDSACFYAPVEFSSIVIERPSGDTASGAIYNIVYMLSEPEF